MDKEKIEGAIEGKIELDTLTDEELLEFRKEAKALADKARGEVTGLREEKRTQAEKLEKLRKDAEEIENERKATEEQLNKGKQEISQFRKEQIEKAKNKFLTQFPDAKEKVGEIEEKFGKLDSGKMDSDFILKDFVAAYAATDPDGYLASREKAKNLEKGAEDFNAQGAAGNPASDPAGGDPEKYSEETKATAKAAGITEEAADKVVKGGMRRKYE